LLSTAYEVLNADGVVPDVEPASFNLWNHLRAASSRSPELSALTELQAVHEHDDLPSLNETLANALTDIPW
jgi:hypothetical protein